MQCPNIEAGETAGNKTENGKKNKINSETSDVHEGLKVSSTNPKSDNKTPILENSKQWSEALYNQFGGWCRRNKIMLISSIALLTMSIVILSFTKQQKKFNTKLVIIGGGRGNTNSGIKSSVHVIDMEKTSPCGVRSLQLKNYIGTQETSVKSLPDGLIGAKGILLKGELVVCGGLDNDNHVSKRCYKMINQNLWAQIAKMSVGRQYYGMTIVEGRVFVGGGWDTDKGWSWWKYDNVESLMSLEQNSWDPETSMPYPIAGHCFITLNDDEIMSIGGMGVEGKSLNQTLIYNLKTKIWRDGIPMNNSRYHHTCAWIKDHNGNGFILVAGGEIGTYFMNPNTYYLEYTLKITTTVEIFDPRQQVWSKFDDLPQEMSGSYLVEDGRGGALLVGGDDKGNYEGYTHDILYLSNKDATWQVTFNTLPVACAHHVAMLIPDSFIQC